MKKTKAHQNFYRIPKPVEGTILLLLMILFYFTLFDVNSTILNYFGPLGTFGRYMNKNYYGLLLVILYTAILAHVLGAIYSLYAAILAHVLEAIYAGILCKVSFGVLLDAIRHGGFIFCMGLSTDCGNNVLQDAGRKGISPILTIIWVVQTLLIGFPSLLRLVEHNQNKKKK